MSNVFIDRDAGSDANRPPRPTTLDDFLVTRADAETPDDFLDEHERELPEQDRDPIAGWHEWLVTRPCSTLPT
jgi:hypothetical protein